MSTSTITIDKYKFTIIQRIGEPVSLYLNGHPTDCFYLAFVCVNVDSKKDPMRYVVHSTTKDNLVELFNPSTINDLIHILNDHVFKLNGVEFNPESPTTIQFAN